MSIFVLSNFIQKRSINLFVLFLRMLNSGKHLSEIAPILNISIARTSVLKDQLFDVKYIPKPWVKDYLDIHFKRIKDEHNALIEVLHDS